MAIMGRDQKMGAPGVTAAMVTILFVQVIVNSISKVAMNRGMSQFVFLLYSNLLCLFLLLPTTFLLSRYRSAPPPLTRSIIFRLLLMGLLSCCLMVFNFLGIKNGSPTLTSAIGDLVPVFTFLLAVFSGMEKLALKSRSSQAKIIGTVVSIAGALTLTLYKGHALNGVISHDNTSPDDHPQSNWIIGAAFSAGGAFSMALSLVVQTWVIKDYPSELMVTLLSFAFGTAFIAMVSLVLVKDLSAWTLRTDLELVAILLMGPLSAFRGVVVTWACMKKGPLFIAMFTPLEMVIAVVVGVSFLGDTLFLGSIIGGIVIAIGFYAVIWGKAEEQKVAQDMMESVYSGLDSSSSHEAPLLTHVSTDK